MKKVILLGITIGLALVGVKLSKKILLPVLNEPWWGPDGKNDTTIKPFKINISDEILIDLKQRLNNKRNFQKPLENSFHHYGTNTDFLEEIVTFWKTKYDWRQREKYLNKYPQFKTQIQGLDIHYVHVKPQKVEGKRVLPMLILHGWPGSFREFYELIPLLTTPREGNDFVFELIIPSLPGYGFSQAASKQGLGATQMGVVFKNLMTRLGFEKYYLQGGDLGSVITSHMSSLFEEKILGLHLNLCHSRTPMTNLKILLGSLYPPLVMEKIYESNIYPLSNSISILLLETGYMHIQATKPDTLGVGLNDSPVGLAAYILDKFITGTNLQYKSLADAGLKSKFKYEDILDNIMIYWVTNSITSAMRLYAETLRKNYFELNLDNAAVNVPTACAKFEHEMAIQPDHMLADKYTNLVQSNFILDVGHFAAMENPGLLADDIWSAVEVMQNIKKE